MLDHSTALLLALTVGMPELVYDRALTKEPVEINGISQSEQVKPRVIDKDVRYLPTMEFWKRGDPVREVPKSSPLSSKDDEPQEILPREDEPRLDPLLGSQEREPLEGMTRAISPPDVNIEGISFTGAFPQTLSGM